MVHGRRGGEDRGGLGTPFSVGQSVTDRVVRFPLASSLNSTSRGNPVCLLLLCLLPSQARALRAYREYVPYDDEPASFRASLRAYRSYARGMDREVCLLQPWHPRCLGTEAGCLYAPWVSQCQGDRKSVV